MPVLIDRSIFLSALLIFAAGPTSAVTHLQFLYINAGEESASGGHVGLKLGDEVFHFQHVPPGLLRIKRDDYAQFRLQYAQRENRTIQMHHVEVAEETLDLLHEHLNRILLIEDEQFDRLEALENDRRLLESLLRQANRLERNPIITEPTDGAERLLVKGAGLFLPVDGHQTDATGEKPKHLADAGIARLAGRIEADYGTAFLPNKTREMVSRLETLKPQAYAASAAALAEDGFRPADYSFSERYADLMAALAAVRVLALGLPLRDGVLLRPKGLEFRLNEAEKLGLGHYRSRLECQLLGLLQTKRTDWGFPLLLGMARLAALDESIASGHWVFLNLAEPRSTIAEPEAGHKEDRQAAYALSRSRFFAAKLVLADSTAADEWAYGYLEQTANVFFELGNAIAEGRAVHLGGMDSTPLNQAAMALLLPAMTAAQLQDKLDNLEDYRSNYETVLSNLYAYNLIGRNCASEIFRIMAVFTQPLEKVKLA